MEVANSIMSRTRRVNVKTIRKNTIRINNIGPSNFDAIITDFPLIKLSELNVVALYKNTVYKRIFYARCS